MWELSRGFAALGSAEKGGGVEESVVRGIAVQGWGRRGGTPGGLLAHSPPKPARGGSGCPCPVRAGLLCGDGWPQVWILRAGAGLPQDLPRPPACPAAVRTGSGSSNECLETTWVSFGG